MESPFKTIGLIGKANHDGAAATLQRLYTFLNALGFNVIVEQRTGHQLAGVPKEKLVKLIELGEQADLAIVVGGDGNMLGAARVLARFDVAVIGVNRGNLGFLTDLNPQEFEPSLEQVLSGQYIEEKRFLLEVEVYRHGELKSANSAVNEAVLHADKVAHMIEFEAFINNDFVFSQRSDGLIVSTPTGSTAYSLSGGGPILTPELNAMSLVPMFPHTLSSRPLVVDADNEVRLKLSLENTDSLQVSCDSHVVLAVLPGDEVVIKKADKKLRLIHPKDYSYYHVLRTKLNWGSRLY
ncbi:inorganic polyphosphate kinase [Pseudoalteromonas porphyrae]|uniref:NAD kinase n=2 Tax=Pseudoalteromonas TaxID=53246 RepID=A0A0N0LWQ5_9GAMM|nr:MULTISPECIES: NAD(+) kinase [Pseudoalteromonas]KPH59701.1 inorganic polyphosphate kinase [Pseudoalteromonas porphyrae]KPH93491.1 inorganic polyphosphate kinase [Pseudoalteromonas porphyrae]NMR27023.1 NAD(+) kinase [Pseudoalteromonas sp. NEC-BIFX-2020_015]NNG44622.1 NAD(+) kinase [Pseudoalteromonas sp. NEC-BIFX-2020_002]